MVAGDWLDGGTVAGWRTVGTVGWWSRTGCVDAGDQVTGIRAGSVRWAEPSIKLDVGGGRFICQVVHFGILIDSALICSIISTW